MEEKEKKPDFLGDIITKVLAPGDAIVLGPFNDEEGIPRNIIVGVDEVKNGKAKVRLRWERKIITHGH